MSLQKLVPELYCSDWQRSLHFYTALLGFRVEYARPEARFAYLSLDGAELMIEQTITAERTFVAAELVPPFGRGINLQIAIANIDPLYNRVSATDTRIFLALEEKWYRKGEKEFGNRQFVVMDPDGYLLRFAQDIGSRHLSPESLLPSLP